jgi:hypothetical protein
MAIVALKIALTRLCDKLFARREPAQCDPHHDDEQKKPQAVTIENKKAGLVR